MNKNNLIVPGSAALALCLALSACGRPAPVAPQAPKAALTVTTVAPEETDIVFTVASQGGVFPWQEASIGPEVSNVRITEILVNVGDRVKKGQVLARLNVASLKQDYAAQQAALSEADAAYAQAQLNAERARQLEGTDAASKQELLQYATAEKTAKAKLLTLRAQAEGQALKVGYATITAPDDGVISARSAAVGQVVSGNTELFRLIRQNRLEWRAEVPGERLADIDVGQTARIQRPDGTEVVGKVRQVAPAVDTATRTGVVFVDIPAQAHLKAGMYLSGNLEQPAKPALTLPAKALVSRDGYNYVMKVDKDSKVVLTKVTTGAMTGSRVAIQRGLTVADQVVESGASFLSQGDVVKVVKKEEAKQ